MKQVTIYLLIITGNDKAHETIQTMYYVFIAELSLIRTPSRLYIALQQKN
jgi:hypothetical protein